MQVDNQFEPNWLVEKTTQFCELRAQHHAWYMGSLSTLNFPRPRLVWTFRQAGGAAQSLVPPRTSVESLSQACPLLLPQTGLGFL